MISLFPTLFVFEFFAPTVLRLALGVVLIPLGYKKMKTVSGFIELAGGILLVLGFLTQAAALAIFVLKLLAILRVGRIGHQVDLLVAAIALSVAILGPGAYSIDYPF